MSDYTINNETLANISCGNDISLVYEGKEMFVINERPNNIIKKNCLKYGSSFEGRLKSAEIITGCKYKSPIVVSGSKRLIFFPTSSPRLKSVSWINMMNIDRVYYNALKKVTVIVFQNDVLLELKVSLNILNNQILKSMQLEHYLRKKRYNRA